MKLISAFAILFCLAACSSKQGHVILKGEHLIPAVGDQIIQPRIVNGQMAHPGQFPYTVRLESNTAELCGGTLIGHEWVLTAAHCLYGYDRVNVYLGSIDLKAGKMHYNVGSNKIYVHSNYDTSTYNNDIALINIKFVSYSRDIAPIALPTIGFRVGVNSVAFIMGWGFTSTNGPESSYLLYTEVQTISNRKCSESTRAINANKLCTKSLLGGPCNGDSGGPLVSKKVEVLIGIMSHSASRECFSRYPDVYTRVSSHLGWIYNHTGPLT